MERLWWFDHICILNKRPIGNGALTTFRMFLLGRYGRRRAAADLPQCPDEMGDVGAAMTASNTATDSDPVPWNVTCDRFLNALNEQTDQSCRHNRAAP